MAIYVIDGYPGSGKTAYMVKQGRILLQRGEKIFPNIKLFPEFLKVKNLTDENVGYIWNKEDRENSEKKILYWKNFDDWFYMKDGTILCDEGIVYFNPRNWALLPDEIQIKLIQHRHEKLDLYITVTHYSRVDLVLRQLCERFIHVDLVLGSKKLKKTFLPRIARITEHHLEDMERQERLLLTPRQLTELSRYGIEPIWTEWFWIKENIFKWYDTAEMIGHSRPMRKHKTCVKHSVEFCRYCEMDNIGAT